MPNRAERDQIDEIIDTFLEVRQEQKEEEERKAFWEEFGQELKEIRQRHRTSQEASKDSPSNP